MAVSGEFYVGRKLWYVSWIGDDRQYEVTIIKLGRTYVYFDNASKVRRELVRANYHDSQEAYEAELALRTRWRALYNALADHAPKLPPLATVERIEAAAELLGVKLEPT